MTKALLLAFTALALGPSASSAAQPAKWYVGAAIGSNWVNDFDVSREFSVAGHVLGHGQLHIDMRESTAYLGSIGYRFTDEWSIQGEWARRSNRSDSVRVSATAFLPENDVRLTSKSVMANAIYTMQGLGAVRPYVGLGIGTARIEMEKLDSLGGSHDKSWAFAYQALLGAEVNMSAQWQLFGQYQHVMAAGPSLNSTSARGTSAFQYQLDTYPVSRTLSVGVRYKF